MLAVAAMASAGWLFLLVVRLVAPPSPGPRRGGGPGDGTADSPAGGTAGGTAGDQAGDEPPAVISLLAGKLDRTGFGATLADLAARGWVPDVPGGRARRGQRAGSGLGTGRPRHVRRARGDAGRAATKGLPDPEELVTPDEAAAVLGGQGEPASVKHAEAGVGRTMTWQHTRTIKGSRPMLRVEVRYAADARPVPPPGAWRAPGVADGYLLGLSGVVAVPPLIALLSIHGTVPSGPERLAGLLPVVEARLRDEVARLSRLPG